MIVNPKAFGQSGVGHSSLWPISYLRNLCLKVTICHPQPTNPPGNPNPPVSPFFYQGTTRAAKHTQRMAARTNLELWEAQSSCKRAFLGAWRWRLVGWWTKPPALPAGTCGVNECLLYFLGGVSTPSKNKVFWPIKTGISFGFQVHPGNKWFIDWWSSRQRINLYTLRSY